MSDNDDDPLDIGSTIRRKAVDGFNAAKEYMDTREPTIQAGRAFMQPDAPGGRALSAVQNAIPTERDIVEGIGGATDAVVGGLSTLGDGVVEGGRLVSVGANQLLDNASSAYSQAAPYFSAAAEGASGGLNAIASNAAEGASQLAPNFTTATTPPEGAPLLNRSRLLSGGDARLPAPHRVGEAVGGFFDSAVDLYNNTPFVDTSGNSPRPGNLEATSAKEGLGNFIGGIADSANAEFASINKGYADRRNGLAPGAPSGVAANQSEKATPTAVYTGEKNPEDAFSPVTEGSGIDIQGKANEARANQSPVSGNSAYDIITNPIGQAQASHENYREAVSRDNYNNARGLNSPDTASTRLPSQGQAITNPLGGGQLNTAGGIVSASSARSAPGDAPYLGGGNAPLSRATGRTTGDGSSNPNSPNFQPVGLGGVPIQSRDQWLAQRAAEKDALYQRRSASNRRDDARRAQESRQEQFDKVVGDLPRHLKDKDRAAAVAKLYDTYLGSSVKASGDDKALAGNLNRDSTGERIASAKLGANATQDAISNQAARAAAAATGQKNSFDQEYKRSRIGQYQAGINETARRNAVLQRKEEYQVGLSYAKNQREALAAQRAGLKLASDMDVQSVGLPELGNYQTNLNTIADLSGASPAQMEEFMKQNPQRY